MAIYKASDGSNEVRPYVGTKHVRHGISYLTRVMQGMEPIEGTLK